MATFNLLPNGVTGTNQWKSPSHGACAASNVDSDDGSTDYCYETTNSHEVSFTLADPSITSGAIDSITSVQLIVSGKYIALSGNMTMRVYKTGTGIAVLSDEHTFSSGGVDYTTKTGTAWTTGGLGAWTYSNLENLLIPIEGCTL